MNDKRQNWPAMGAIRLAAYWPVGELESIRYGAVFQWKHRSYVEGRAEVWTQIMSGASGQGKINLGN